MKISMLFYRPIPLFQTAQPLWASAATSSIGLSTEWTACIHSTDLHYAAAPRQCNKENYTNGSALKREK